MADHDPRERTRTIARILGPYLVIAAGALYVRQASLPDFFQVFIQDAPLVFVTGAFTVLAGLGLIAAHHHWSSVSAAIISVIGLLASVKGAALMIAPQIGVEATDILVRQPQVLMVGIGVDAILGLWLTFAGWRPRPAQPLPT